MTGFRRDDEPRTWEAIQRPSGLWVAGHDWLDRYDPQPARPSGDVFAVTERGPDWTDITAKTRRD